MGPPLRGLAHVDWWVISFDIPINVPGRQPDAEPPGDAGRLADVRETSLPRAAASARPGRRRPAVDRHHPDRERRRRGDIWLFSGDALGLSTESVIPASTLSSPAPAPRRCPGSRSACTRWPAARRSRCTGSASPLDPATTWQPGQPLPAGIDVSGWGWAVVKGDLPAALWGVRGSQGAALDGRPRRCRVTGLTGIGQATQAANSPCRLRPARRSSAARGLALGAGPSADRPAPAGDTRSQVAATIDDPAVTALRSAVPPRRSVRPGGGPGHRDVAAARGEIYAALTGQPMLGPPGRPARPPRPRAAGSTRRGPSAARGTAPPARRPSAAA